MLKKKAATFFLYTAAAAVIVGWWYVAFKPQGQSIAPLVSSKSRADKSQITSPFSTLTPIDRDVLHKALAGDTALMTQLIADWDVDAQLLGLAGHANVKRLSRHKYLRSQVLGRQLTLPNGNMASAAYSPRMLAQTYAAASFLLALVEPEQIVALPKGLREQTHLFPTELTNQIPLDIDRYNAETLYLAQPKIAFIAYYSNPSLVQALKNQGTELVTLLASNSFGDIHQTLMQIGDAVGRSLKAELLSLFMEASMQAIDNRLLLLENELLSDPAPSILLVNYYSQYSLPSARTLTGQILQRMGVPNTCSEEDAANTGAWVFPLNKEQITRKNPHCLIIATPSPEQAKAQIMLDPAMAQLEAMQHNRVYFVDEAVQQFPSQYLVLAYYDIAQALLAANE